MNAKASKPEVAKTASKAVTVAQPKAAVQPKAPVAEKAQLPVASTATGFKDQPAIVAKAGVAVEPQQGEKVANIKGVAAQPQKAKPQLKMLRVIAKKGNHPGTGLRIKRWHLYKEGMTLQHCKETEGLSHLEPLFWQENGLMVLRDATEAEYKAALEAWQKGNEAKKTA